MNRSPARLIPLILVTSGGCGAGDSLYGEEVYAAAITEADGEDGLEGTPGDDSAPGAADARPRPEAEALHFSCDLRSVEARARSRGCDEAGDRHVEGGPAHEMRREGRGAGERRGSQPLALRRLRWVYDADRDGALEDTERAELEADLEVRCENRQARLLRDFDADGDRALDDAELETARRARAAVRADREAARLEAFDVDSDAVLSHEERRAAHEARRTRLLATYDADESGDLDPSEEAHLRAFLRRVVRGEVARPDR